MAPAHVSLRTGRHSVAGGMYLVTFTTHQRRARFADWEIASEAARVMTAPVSWPSSTLLAWVLMPDHWHGLLVLGKDDTLAACVGRLKGRTSRLLRRGHPALGPVWATAYHDPALRVDEDVETVARYLVMNPVRASLVGHVGDYPYWDAVWLGGRARG